MVPAMGYIVLRFVADNPGICIFHCHIDWHLSQGLAVLMVEAPDVMQQTINVPENHYQICKAANVPSAGNAAGNVKDFLDLSGQNVQAGFVPYGGFTTKGYVAMAFSVLSAFLGMAALTLYGLTDAKVGEHDI